jgi:hypothetical protein
MWSGPFSFSKSSPHFLLHLLPRAAGSAILVPIDEVGHSIFSQAPQSAALDPE